MPKRSAVKLTKQVVDVTTPGVVDRYVWDCELRGFGLKVTPAGRKVYVLQYQVGSGRSAPTRRYTIGPHGNPWTPDGARKEALALKAKVSQGADPMAEKQQARAATKPATVNELIDEFLERWSKPFKRTAAEDERILNKDVRPALGKKAVNAVSRRDIVELIDKIVARGKPIAANRTLRVVSRMFNFAIERGLLEEGRQSPCFKVKPPGQEKARDRVLSDEEIVTFWDALDRAHMERNIARILRLVLITGQRSGEVAGMRERELDREARIWTIPAARAKNGRTHFVPLSSLALEIIGEPQKDADGKIDPEQLIFPSGRTGEAYAKQSLDHAVRDMFVDRQRKPKKSKSQAPAKPAAEPILAGHARFKPHDLRRTAATIMRRLGTSRDDVGLVLNHKSQGVTGRHYDQYEGLAEKSRALDLLASYLNNLTAPAGDNVVVLHQAQ